MMNEDKIKNETDAIDETNELDNEDLEGVAGGIRRHGKRIPLGKRAISDPKMDDDEKLDINR